MARETTSRRPVSATATATATTSSSDDGVDARRRRRRTGAEVLRDLVAAVAANVAYERRARVAYERASERDHEVAMNKQSKLTRKYDGRGGAHHAEERRVHRGVRIF